MNREPDWTKPGVTEAAPGVHRIPLPLQLHGLQAVNVYAVEDGESLTLIDAGLARSDSLELLGDGLRALGRHLDEVARVLVTHMHGDHYSQAVPIRRAHGSRIAVGEGERANLETLVKATEAGLAREAETSKLLLAGGNDLVKQFATALRVADLQEAYEWPDDWLDDQEQIQMPERLLQVIATPGHTQGHVVFHDAGNQLLFAGDHILPWITPSIGYEPVPAPSPLADFLSSLARVRRMPDAKLLPAHGPVVESAHARIDELIDHHEQRLEAVAKVLEQGAETGVDVARQLQWTRRNRSLGELDLFNQYLAINETLAHLEVLNARGWADRRTRNDGAHVYTVDYSLQRGVQDVDSP
jgi:glyoxylase-like metal-dependent hydrolase (beta-lactamase superfamily II)